MYQGFPIISLRNPEPDVPGLYPCWLSLRNVEPDVQVLQSHWISLRITESNVQAYTLGE